MKSLFCAVVLLLFSANVAFAGNGDNPTMLKAKKESIFKKMFKNKSKHESLEQGEQLDIIHKHHMRRLLTVVIEHKSFS